MKKRQSVVLVIAAMLASLLLVVPAQAVEGLEGFDPNYLISDEAMYGDVSSSMSEEDIAAFLSDKGKNCVRGQDGSACLKDARFNTQTFPASHWCPEPYEGADNESAAAVIAKSARACKISPKVLLVLLQKEQGLIQTKNPTKRAYDRATGFACPDTAPCDPAKAGFATQVYAAASRLQQYKAQPNRFNFAVGRTTRIGYHPNASCGFTTVTPKTAATAALYNYTPYVPNAAALANPYGSGDSCSAYGNRNFFRIHSDWFGQPNEDTSQPDSSNETLSDNEKQEENHLQDPQHSSEPGAPQNTDPQEKPTIVTAENLKLLSQSYVNAPEGILGAFPIGNWDGSGLTDVVKVEHDGRFIFFSHPTPSEYSRGQGIGQGWGSMRVIAGNGDFDGDGKDDLLTLRNDHKMFLYRGRGDGRFESSGQIGHGWGAFSQLVIMRLGPNKETAVLAQGRNGSHVYATSGRGRWMWSKATDLPALQGAIAGPDLTGTGYSTLIVPENSEKIALYATQDGVNFNKFSSMFFKQPYKQLLNVTDIPGSTAALIEVLLSSGEVYTVSVEAGNSIPAPKEPSEENPGENPAPPASHVWTGIAFDEVFAAGQGWSQTHTYSMGDFNGDATIDASIMRSNGDLMYFPSEKSRSFPSHHKIGQGWNSLLDYHTGIDFDGDTRPDVVARAKNGALLLYLGDGRGNFTSSKQIGVGWSGFDSIKLLRQGPNGHPIIIAISGKKIRAYPTNGRGVFSGSTVYDAEYPWLKDAFVSDDWNNDGRSDLLYIDEQGRLLVSIQTSNGFSDPYERQIGQGWGSFARLVPSHFDHRTKSVWAVDKAGILRTYVWVSSEPAGAFQPPRRTVPMPIGHEIVNRSFREGSWLKHPIQWKGQPDDETCGPTSMWMVLNYLGAHRSAYDGKPLDVWTLKGRNYANVGTGYSGGTSWEEKRLSVGMNRWLGKNVYSQWSFPSGWDFRFKVIDSFNTGRPVVVDTIENYGGPHYNGHVGQSSHIIVVSEYHAHNGAIGFVDPGGPGSAISGYSAQRYFRYPSAVDFGNNFLGNYGGGGHGMVY